MTTVPNTEPASEPDYYAEIAAELRRIADDLDKIGPGAPKPYFSIDIHPGTALRGDDEKVVAAVDQVAMALLGKRGKTILMSDGNSRHHDAKGSRGPVSLAVYNSISTKAEVDAVEAQRAKDDELERLRAELAKLKAATDTTGDSFGREPDEVKPTSAVPAHVDGHPEFSGRASVPDMRTCTCPLGPEDAHFPDCPMAVAAGGTDSSAATFRDPAISGAWAGAEARHDAVAMRSMIDEAHAAAIAQAAARTPQCDKHPWCVPGLSGDGVSTHRVNVMNIDGPLCTCGEWGCGSLHIAQPEGGE